MTTLAVLGDCVSPSLVFSQHNHAFDLRRFGERRLHERRSGEQRSVHRYCSATARCSDVSGVLTINYAGVINQAGFHRLDTETLQKRLAAPVAFERMNYALTLPGDVVVCDDAWPVGTPPSAVIVRDDQYQQSMLFCVLLRARGILRLTFLQHQAEHALRWARRYQLHAQ